MKGSIFQESGKICLLLVLYTLQGIPIGLSSSVPFLLQSKISYKQQSILALCSLPFSFKLLWAPIVDGIYSQRLGRRRSWLIPLQLLAGGFMILVNYPNDRISDWLAEGSTTKEPNVVALALFFSILYFLMATQDIAVDGWALTILSEENRGHASTCNAIGQTFGYCLAYVGFLALNDPGVSRKLLPGYEFVDRGIINLSEFMYFFGWIFILTTLFVIVFFNEEGDTRCSCTPYAKLSDDVELESLNAAKNSALEQSHGDTSCRRASTENASPAIGEGTDEYTPKGIKDSYKLLLQLLKIHPIQQLMLCLLTCRVAFAAVDASTQLKIISRGVPKEELAFFAPLLLPLGILSPVFIGRWVTGDRPLQPFLSGYMLRIFMNVVWMLLVALTPVLYYGNHSSIFYACLFLVTCLSYMCSDLMFVSLMAFFARVSDPHIGGTYMTFLNTSCNLGAQWPNALSLWLLDVVTFRDCTNMNEDGTCPIWLDGYFVLVTAGCLFGFIWCIYVLPIMERLQNLDPQAWRVEGIGEFAQKSAIPIKETSKKHKPLVSTEDKSD